MIDNEKPLGKWNKTDVQQFVTEHSAKIEKIQKFSSELEENAEKIKEAANEILDHTEEDDYGHTVEKQGYVSEMKEKLAKFEEDYNDLHSKTEALRKEIKEKLNAGATTIGLSDAFRGKAVEYTKARTLLDRVIFGLFLVGIGAAISLLVFLVKLGWSLESLLYLLPSTFAATLFTWMMLFLIKSRAENKKLEEIYKHKESLASSYLGYEEYIAKLESGEENLSSELMKNLLEALKTDPSEFLKVKGGNHPAKDVIGALQKAFPNLSNTR